MRNSHHVLRGPQTTPLQTLAVRGRANICTLVSLCTPVKSLSLGLDIGDWAAACNNIVAIHHKNGANKTSGVSSERVRVSFLYRCLTRTLIAIFLHLEVLGVIERGTQSNSSLFFFIPSYSRRVLCTRINDSSSCIPRCISNRSRPPHT